MVACFGFRSGAGCLPCQCEPLRWWKSYPTSTIREAPIWMARLTAWKPEFPANAISP